MISQGCCFGAYQAEWLSVVGPLLFDLQVHGLSSNAVQANGSCGGQLGALVAYSFAAVLTRCLVCHLLCINDAIADLTAVKV